MNSEKKALLAGIAKKPYDDTPRLVYADWLDEHNDPERAEFIRLQIRKSHLDAGDVFPEEGRMNELLKKNAATWDKEDMEQLSPYIRNDDRAPENSIHPYERGFRREFDVRTDAVRNNRAGFCDAFEASACAKMHVDLGDISSRHNTGQHGGNYAADGIDRRCFFSNFPCISKPWSLHVEGRELSGNIVQAISEETSCFGLLRELQLTCHPGTYAVHDEEEIWYAQAYPQAQQNTLSRNANSVLLQLAKPSQLNRLERLSIDFGANVQYSHDAVVELFGSMSIFNTIVDLHSADPSVVAMQDRHNSTVEMRLERIRRDAIARPPADDQNDGNAKPPSGKWAKKTRREDNREPQDRGWV